MVFYCFSRKLGEAKTRRVDTHTHRDFGQMAEPFLEVVLSYSVFHKFRERFFLFIAVSFFLGFWICSYCIAVPFQIFEGKKSLKKILADFYFFYLVLF